MQLETCWATPTSDSEHPDGFTLINDFCPTIFGNYFYSKAFDNYINNLGKQVNVETTEIGQSQLADIKFRRFTFSYFPKLYLHCAVNICVETDQSSCLIKKDCSAQECILNHNFHVFHVKGIYNSNRLIILVKNDNYSPRKRREQSEYTKIVSLGPIQKSEKIDLIFDRQARRLLHLVDSNQNKDLDDLVKSKETKSIKFALTYSIAVISIIVVLALIVLFVTRIWRE